MNLKQREERAGAAVGIGAAIIVVMAFVLSGCGVPQHTVQAEVSRNAVINNRQAQAGSLFLDVNPYTCTWVVDRIYRGRLSREQAIGNVSGKVAFYDDYIYKVELTNAITYNQDNGASAPNVARIILEPNKVYTIVRYVGSGRSIFHKDYALQVFWIFTDTNAARQYWTNRFNASESANIVSVADGSNTPSYNSLDLHFQINGTQIGRDFVGSAIDAAANRR